jgi:hypothetical protein
MTNQNDTGKNQRKSLRGGSHLTMNVADEHSVAQMMNKADKLPSRESFLLKTT